MVSLTTYGPSQVLLAKSSSRCTRAAPAPTLRSAARRCDILFRVVGTRALCAGPPPMRRFRFLQFSLTAKWLILTTLHGRPPGLWRLTDAHVCVTPIV